MSFNRIQYTSLYVELPSLGMNRRDGDVCILAGCILSMTIIGAVIGIPLLFIGLLITLVAPESEELDDSTASK